MPQALIPLGMGIGASLGAGALAPVLGISTALGTAGLGAALGAAGGALGQGIQGKVPRVLDIGLGALTGGVGGGMAGAAKGLPFAGRATEAIGRVGTPNLSSLSGLPAGAMPPDVASTVLSTSPSRIGTPDFTNMSGGNYPSSPPLSLNEQLTQSLIDRMKPQSLWDQIKAPVVTGAIGTVPKVIAAAIPPDAPPRNPYYVEGTDQRKKAQSIARASRQRRATRRRIYERRMMR